MFYGREDILADLSELWRKSAASLVPCRGRRRIGKSTLIEEFALCGSVSTWIDDNIPVVPIEKLFA